MRKPPPARRHYLCLCREAPAPRLRPASSVSVRHRTVFQFVSTYGPLHSIKNLQNQDFSLYFLFKETFQFRDL